MKAAAPAWPRRGLSATILLLALAGCATVATTAERLTAPDKEYYQTFAGPYIDKIEPRPEEKPAPAAAGGKGLIAQARLSQGVVEAAELEGYLNRILDRLKAVSPRPAYPAHVYLTPQPSFDAYATGDGTIFLSLGALKAVACEDDLAVLLGHELAHLVLDHHDLNTLDKITQLAVGVGVMGERLLQSPGQAVTGEVDASNSTGAAVIQFVAEELLTPTFTRQQEDEADLLGVDLVVRAKYSRERVAAIMKRMAQGESAAAKAKAELRLRQRSLRALKAQQAGGLGAFGQAFGQAMDDLDRSLSESLHGVREDHRPPEARLDSLQGYLNDRFAELEIVPPDKAGLEAALAERQTQTILGAYARAEEAYAKAQAGDIRAALPLIRSALAGPTAFHARPREIAFRIDMERGREAEAIEHLRAVLLRAPYPPLGFYGQLIQLHIDRAKLSEAMGFAEEASRRFDEPAELWPQLIYLNKALDRRAEATRLLLRCRTDAPAELLERCLEADRGKVLKAAGLGR